MHLVEGGQNSYYTLPPTVKRYGKTRESQSGRFFEDAAVASRSGEVGLVALPDNEGLQGHPHSVNDETANFMILGRELQLSDQLQLQPPPAEETPQNENCQDLVQRLGLAHEVL